MSQVPARGGGIGRAAGGLVVLLLGLAGGGLIALSPDIGMALVVLLLPGLFMLILDRSPGCAVARAILLFQAAACVHPVMDAWYNCSGVDGCIGYMAAWPVVLRVWLAGGVAWVLGQILPLGLKLLDDYWLRYRRAALIAKREALLAEWGLGDDQPR